MRKTIEKGIYSIKDEIWNKDENEIIIESQLRRVRDSYVD